MQRSSLPQFPARTAQLCLGRRWWRVWQRPVMATMATSSAFAMTTPCYRWTRRRVHLQSSPPTSSVLRPRHQRRDQEKCVGDGARASEADRRNVQFLRGATSPAPRVFRRAISRHGHPLLWSMHHGVFPALRPARAREGAAAARMLFGCLADGGLRMLRRQSKSRAQHHMLSRRQTMRCCIPT